MKRSAVLRKLIILSLSFAAFFAFSSSIFIEAVQFWVTVKTSETEDTDDYSCDMLIKLDDSDKWYTAYNEAAMMQIPQDSGIVTYSEGGYRSVLAHFKGSTMSEYSSFSVCIPEDWEKQFGKNRKAYDRFCRQYKTAKLALFDETGTIAAVSEEFPLVRAKIFSTYPNITWDIDSGSVDCHYMSSSTLMSLTAILLWAARCCSVIAVLLLVIDGIIEAKKGRRSGLMRIFAVLLNVPFVIGAAASAWLTLGTRDMSLYLAFSAVFWAAAIFIYSGEFIILITTIILFAKHKR